MKKRIIIISTLIGIISLSLLGICYYNSKLVLELDGDSELNLSVNSDYQEQGYKALFHNKDITNQVEVSNDLDTSKIGNYTIKYHIKNFIKNITKERKVNIVDTESPIITLIGDSNMTMYLNTDYKEYGYEVKDNYDQDLTDKVSITNNIDKTKEGTYEVVYTVSDSSNNETSIKRTVTIKNRPVSTNIKLPVLMYHFFYDPNTTTPPDTNWMNINLFEEQVKYLSENDYYFPTWDEVNNYLDGKIALPTKSIVITADDGNESFFRLAYPILKKYNVRATSFIVTSWAQPSSEYDSNILSYQSHSNDMHKGGCTGGHGGLFRCINDTAGLSDLVTSKKIANDATVFCYPFGDVTDKEVSLVKQAGYLMAFTTSGGKIGPGMDKYRLPRVRMSNGITLARFISSIN